MIEPCLLYQVQCVAYALHFQGLNGKHRSELSLYASPQIPSSSFCPATIQAARVRILECAFDHGLPPEPSHVSFEPVGRCKLLSLTQRLPTLCRLPPLTHPTPWPVEWLAVLGAGGLFPWLLLLLLSVSPVLTAVPNQLLLSF